MLSLENFEKQVAVAILKRGKQYYGDGAVIDLDEVRKNEWKATVVGSDHYSVEVVLQQNNVIMDCSCDCPYDDRICKHVVAVFYALREEENSMSAKKERKTKKITFDQLLEKIRLEEYQEFILQYAGTDKKFKTAFEIWFADKLEYLKAIGRYGEVNELTSQHMDVVEVRLDAVDKAIAQQDFVAAKVLIAEGIKIARDKDHPGTVAKWEKVLLRIAVLEKDIPNIRYYTKHFAFDRGFNKEYYTQWKKTFTDTEWKQVIEAYLEERINHINEVYEKNKKRVWYLPNTILLEILAPVYIEEHYWDRLLVLVQQETDMNRILHYHEHLLKIYPAELLAVYLPALELLGDKSSNRSQYAHLAGIIKKLIHSMPEGKEQLIAITKKLIVKYPRRPAMVEELRAVIG